MSRMVARATYPKVYEVYNVTTIGLNADTRDAN